MMYYCTYAGQSIWLRRTEVEAQIYHHQDQNESAVASDKCNIDIRFDFDISTFYFGADVDPNQ